jgi:hypothetical protein
MQKTVLMVKRTNKRLNHNEEKTASLPTTGGRLTPATQERKIKTSKTNAVFVDQKRLNSLYNIGMQFTINMVKSQDNVIECDYETKSRVRLSAP